MRLILTERAVTQKHNKHCLRFEDLERFQK